MWLTLGVVGESSTELCVSSSLIFASVVTGEVETDEEGEEEEEEGEEFIAEYGFIN